jgi:phosphoglycolate phosphatase-like HAD superfamily hydrolase
MIMSMPFINAMRKGGYVVSRADANALMGSPQPYAIHELLKMKRPDAGQINDSLIDALLQYFLSELLDFYPEDTSIQPTKDAEDVFAELQVHRMKVALDSGFSRDIAAVNVQRFGWWEEKGPMDDFTACIEGTGKDGNACI